MNRKALGIAIGLIVLIVVVVVVMQRTGPTSNGGAGTGFHAASTCPHSPGVPISIPLVVNAANDITGPSPRPIVCPKDYIVWSVKNDCATCGDVLVTIDAKRHVCGDETQLIDFLEDVQSSGKKCSPSATVAYNQQLDMNANKPCKVKTVKDGCYKYWLSGTYTIEPEVDVQGGIGGLDISPKAIPAQSPTPSASPSK